MGLWPTHADENPVTAPHPLLPEGAAGNSPGQAKRSPGEGRELVKQAPEGRPKPSG
jgi:hypothetical protein